jgi:hypothetical protein
MPVIIQANYSDQLFRIGLNEDMSLPRAQFFNCFFKRRIDDRE